MMIRIVLMMSALVLFAACDKYEEIDVTVNEDEVVTDGVSQSVVLPDIIHTYVSDYALNLKTRTYIRKSATPVGMALLRI